MKSLLPVSALIVLFASCTTAYKSGQTPDDVYFSPARPHSAARTHDEYARVENNQDRYSYDEQADDDRYLRMKVRNRRTWSDLDYYYSDPFTYNYNRFNNYGSLYYNTPWNYYSSWNYYYNPYSNYYNYSYNPYYNPYGSKVIVVNAKPPVYNRPRTFNLNTYNPQANGNGYDAKTPSASRRAYRGDNRNSGYNSRNSSSQNDNNAGRGLRNVFGNSNTSSNTSTQNSTTAPTRSERASSTSTPSPAPSRSSTNAPVRKF